MRTRPCDLLETLLHMVSASENNKDDLDINKNNETVHNADQGPLTVVSWSTDNPITMTTLKLGIKIT